MKHSRHVNPTWVLNVFNVNVTQQGYKNSQTLFKLSETNLVNRFKKDHKMYFNVIYIVNNLVTTRVFAKLYQLEQYVVIKCTVTISSFYYILLQR